MWLGTTAPATFPEASACSDSSPETSASHALRAVQISPEAPRLLMRSWIPASETVSQRQTGRAVCRCAQSESNETMREHAREGRPDTWPRHSAGPPKLKRGDLRARNPCFQVWVAKRRTHAAKREPVISVWGREARAFTLNRSASQFRARVHAKRDCRSPTPSPAECRCQREQRDHARSRDGREVDIVNTRESGKTHFIECDC